MNIKTPNSQCQCSRCTIARSGFSGLANLNTKAVTANVEVIEDEQVGDVNSDARGSGARYNAGKPSYALFPMHTIQGACQVLAYGMRKYAAWNWAKGSDHSVPFDSMMRHLAAWQSGEDVDAESGLRHLDHAMCNMMFLLYYSEHYPEMDDRFKRPEPGNPYDRQSEAEAELQAQIDALMLEHCPEDMTEEQMANYALHQVPSKELL